jgi:hypothetical protein
VRLSSGPDSGSEVLSSVRPTQIDVPDVETGEHAHPAHLTGVPASVLGVIANLAMTTAVPRVLWSGGLAAQQQGPSPQLVEPFEDVVADLEDAVVRADHGETAQSHVEARGFRYVVAIVFEIGLVHDGCDVPQDGIVEL